MNRKNKNKKNKKSNDSENKKASAEAKLSYGLTNEQSDEDSIEKLPILLSVRAFDTTNSVMTVLAQLLPGITSPIVALITMSIATLMVLIGVIDITKEYKETCRELVNISKRQLYTQKKLSDLMSLSDKWHIIIASKFGLDWKSFYESKHYDDFRRYYLPKKEDEKNALAYYISKYLTLGGKELTLSLSKKYGWVGIVGLTGIFFGVAISAVLSGLALANQNSITIFSVTMNTKFITKATGGLFFISQLFMAGYTLNKIIKGRMIIRLFKKAQRTFKKQINNYISESVKENAGEIFSKQIHYVQQHSIKFGYYSTAGNIITAVGTLLGILKSGSWISIILLVIGISVTLLLTAYRVLHKIKESSFKGQNLLYVSQFTNDLLPLKIIAKYYQEEGEKCYALCLADMEKVFTKAISNLAITKGLYWLFQVINEQSSQDKTPLQKFSKLEILLRKSASKFTIDTDIEKNIRVKVKEFYDRDKDGIISLFTLNSVIANKCLLFCVLECLKSDFEKGVEVRIDDNTIQKGKQKLKTLVFNKEIIKKLEIKSTDYSNSKELTLKTIRQAKGAYKAIRYQVFEFMANIADILGIYKELSKSQKSDLS